MNNAFGWSLVGLLAVAVAGTGIITFRELTAPPAVEWVQTESPVATGESLSFRALVSRRPIEGCSNSAQVELLSRGEVTRLPVPTRVIRGNRSTYTTELIEPLSSGRHTARVVEITNCGRPELTPSPWLVFEVPSVRG